MKVKRYIANSMPEAMTLVKAELGLDAVILHTRQIRKGGLWGFFGRSMVEVTAASEDQSPLIAKTAKSPQSQSLPLHNHPVKVTGQQTKELMELFDQRFAHLQADLKETKHFMRHLLDNVEPVAHQEPALPTKAKYMWRKLVGNDVDPDLATELINGVVAESPHASQWKELLVSKIQSVMESATEEPPHPMPRVISLIGPTGVGKTTTIAKLAARSALVEKKKVGLVTVDTYRIAAVEQLKTYAKILGVPVEVVFTPGELRQTLDKWSDLDCIFIDTAGRSHKNAMQMSEIKGFIDAAQPDLTYLVLSLTTKYSDMMDIIGVYDTLEPNGLVFTKLDETDSCGAMFNIIALLQKKLAFITTGQNVPDDIEVANPLRLTELIAGIE